MIKQIKRNLKKKTKKYSRSGIVHVNSTFNNTIINITDNQGNTLFWSSAGESGFKSAKKSTPFAAQLTAEKVARKAYENGLRTVRIFLTGPGRGRETAVRTLKGCGLQILTLKDTTPLPHNGCRPPKRRRI